MNGRVWPDHAEINELNLFRYVDLACRWWRLVVIVTLAMMLLAGVITRFALIHWYRAETILRPVSQHQSPAINQLVGGVGEIASMLGAAGDQTDMKAEEFISTVESYDFITALIERDNLGPHLDATRSRLSRLLFPHPSNWSRFKLMLGRIDADYSARTGNLTLRYEDNDPQNAAKVLGLIVTALREKVQRRELETAHAAAASLLEEADRSADALLRSQIYLMAADQIKQEKLAQINADFAFFLIQSPVSPDRPSRPSVVVSMLLTGMLTLIGLILAIALLDQLEQLRQRNQMVHHTIVLNEEPLRKGETGTIPAPLPRVDNLTRKRPGD
jgi:hypothetical protein